MGEFDLPSPSWPDLFRPSTSGVPRRKSWMAVTSTAMTNLGRVRQAACTQLMRQRLIQDARLEEAVKRLVEGLHSRAIILFGSRARGTNRADSDYDLLVVSERLLDYDEAYRPVAGRGLRCDVVPCTVDAWRQARLDAGGVLRDALDEGIVLYGQS